MKCIYLCSGSSFNSSLLQMWTLMNIEQAVLVDWKRFCQMSSKIKSRPLNVDIVRKSNRVTKGTEEHSANCLYPFDVIIIRTDDDHHSPHPHYDRER